jgi:alpha-tubulin suppressor-like RCC1 family protein
MLSLERATPLLALLAAGCLNTDPVTISIPTGPLTFLSVVSSRNHSCALTPAGAAYCWGVNGSGELGDGTQTDRTVPTAVSGSVVFSSLAAGRSTTCGLTADGSAYCWGLNGTGQIGDGTTTSRTTPVAAAGGHKFSTIAFSDNVQAPPYEVCGLETTGAVFCWGVNNLTPIAAAAGFTFVAFSAGIGGTFCGIVASHDAYCWGFNHYGELGNDSTSDVFRTAPSLVSGSHAFASISVGFAHVCAITTDSHLYCWGNNAYAQLATGGTISTGHPGLVFGDAAYATVTAGYDGACALDTAGAALCWGYSTSGNLGIGPVTDGLVPFPEPVVGGGTIASISKGLYNSCYVTTTHVAYCWGGGGSGLGIGDDGYKLFAAYRPTKVALQPAL